MAAILVGLKWRLLRAGLRGSPSRVVGVVLAALAGLSITLITLAGELAVRSGMGHGGLRPDDVRAVVVLFGTLVALGWALFPLIMFGVDETVDPARFALLPLRGRHLVPGLTGAALIGVPGVATTVSCLGTVVLWSVSAPAALAALVCAPLAALSCVLGSRVVVTAASRSLGGRRTRDATSVIGALLAASLGIVPTLVASRAVQGVDVQAWSPLAHTPLGWVWAVPGDVATGEYLWAALHFMLALGWVAVLAWGWARLLDRTFTERSSGGAMRSAKGRPSLIDRLPQPSSVTARQTVAVLARSLRYWRRDTRYLSAFAPLLVLTAAAAVVPRVMPDGPPAALAIGVGPMLAWVCGLVASNDAGYDGSAFATQLICGVRGVADRAGRVLAWALVMVPLLGTISLIGCYVGGRGDLSPAVLGLTLAMLLGSLGAGSVVGVVVPFALPPAGSNPFRSNTGGGLNAFLAQLAVGAIGFGASLLPAAMLIAYLAGWTPGRWLALPLGLLTGTAVAALGVFAAGGVLDQRGPEMLAALRRPA